MASQWTSKLTKFAKAVAENLPKVGEVGAAALVGIPLKRSTSVSFKDFIRRISLCESQDEIEHTIVAELASLEQLLSQPAADGTVRAQALSVAIYCHLLGYDVRFICIHAITLAQQGSLLQKRMGYLAVSLLLRPTDELAVLLINTLLGDLRSPDVLVVCTALNMVCHLVTADSAATFLAPVTDKLKHRQAVVRDKATRALHSLLLRAPELLPSQLETVEAALLDRDPIVMTSAIQLCLTFAALNPALFAHLTTSLMTILGQVQSRKLPPDFEHKGVPAPWLQCSLIRLISYLCPADSGLSDTFSQFLLSQLTAPVPASVMGFAILCECISAAATLPPPAAPPDPAGGDSAAPSGGLHAAALRCAALLLRSANNNVRYAGLSALCRLCEVGGARPAGPLQLAVVQCLRDEDETVRLRALQLLHAVATEQSAAAVCQRLLEAAAAADRRPVRALLLSRAALLAEQHVARRPQLLHVVNTVLEQDPAPAARLRQRLSAEPASGPLRPAAARLYAELVVGGAEQPAPVQELALWVVGETGHLLESELLVRTVDAVCDRLPGLAAEDPHRDPEQGEAGSPLQQNLRALQRLVWECGSQLPAAAAARLSSALPPLRRCPDPAAAELARSALALLGDGERLRRAAAVASAVLSGRHRADYTLSFADGVVAAALERGAPVLRPPVSTAAAGSVRLGASAPATSERSSPSMDAGTPFETLGPLPLPRFLSADDGDSSVEEPPPVWTLQGRTAGPPPSAPPSASADPSPADTRPADLAPTVQDETAREVAALFPSGNS